MKYLVNRETKEHRIADSETVRTLKVHALATGGPEPDMIVNRDGVWDVVEADAEGWIKWDQSSECPVRKGVECELLVISTLVVSTSPQDYEWRKVKAYRPILDKPEVVDDTPYPVGDTISRLKSAHEAAQSIPDLLAELREALGPELLKMLVDAPQPAVDPEPDMTDWRNWREGDWLMCIKKDKDHCDDFVLDEIYEIDDIYKIYGMKGISIGQWVCCKIPTGARQYSSLPVDHFRFHFRPE